MNTATIEEATISNTEDYDELRSEVNRVLEVYGAKYALLFRDGYDEQGRFRVIHGRGFLTKNEPVVTRADFDAVDARQIQGGKTANCVIWDATGYLKTVWSFQVEPRSRQPQ